MAQENRNQAAEDQSLIQDLQAFLDRKPEYYDVIFIVGPEGTEVKALKVILMAASVIFEHEFDGTGDVQVDGSGSKRTPVQVVLPEFDPVAFQLCIKLTSSDTWSVKTLENLSLPSDKLLSLISICERFEIKKGLKTLNEYQINLKASTEATDRKASVPDSVSVSANLRASTVLSLTKDFEIVDSPPFVCDGIEKLHLLASNEKIALHGLGFLGPIAGESYYDVTVRICHATVSKYLSKIHKKRILAQKDETFHFLFDEPIILEAEAIDKLENYYDIYYSLKGSNTRSIDRDDADEARLTEDGVQFRVEWHSNQLSEILFSKL